jgi:hypothetical protein
MAQLKPLCAAVAGSEQGAANLRATACIDAVIDTASKENPGKMRQALVGMAEVQAGRRVAPRGNLEPIEALMLALANETSAFEADLATRFGPDEALRIAASRGLCMERRTVHSQDQPLTLTRRALTRSPHGGPTRSWSWPWARTVF